MLVVGDRLGPRAPGSLAVPSPSPGLFPGAVCVCLEGVDMNRSHSPLSMRMSQVAPKMDSVLGSLLLSREVGCGTRGNETQSLASETLQSSQEYRVSINEKANNIKQCCL